MRIRSLEDDLVRFGEGTLSEAELRRRHPDDAVDALIDLDRVLSSFGDMPAPDAKQSWEALVTRLPDRTPPLATRFLDRLRRPVVAALASALLTGGVAYAAGVEPVRAVVDGAWNRVVSLFGGGDDSPPIRDGIPIPMEERGIGPVISDDFYGNRLPAGQEKKDNRHALLVSPVSRTSAGGGSSQDNAAGDGTGQDKPPAQSNVTNDGDEGVIAGRDEEGDDDDDADDDDDTDDTDTSDTGGTRDTNDEGSD